MSETVKAKELAKFLYEDSQKILVPDGQFTTFEEAHKEHQKELIIVAERLLVFIQEPMNARKIKLLKKYDHKLGQAFKQGKFKLADYFSVRISTTLEIFSRSKLNKSYCPNWLKLHQLSRDFVVEVPAK